MKKEKKCFVVVTKHKTLQNTHCCCLVITQTDLILQTTKLDVTRDAVNSNVVANPNKTLLYFSYMQYVMFKMILYKKYQEIISPIPQLKSLALALNSHLM